MKVVYLDQNHWITLAKAANGKGDEAALGALAVVRGASAEGSAIFPLSAIHYVETAKIRDADRRQRLAATMLEVSGGRTLASFRDLIAHEIDVALKALFPSVAIRPFALIGNGASHAFSNPNFHYRLPDFLRRVTDPRIVDAIEAAVGRRFEEAALGGVSKFGLIQAPFRVTTQNEQFRDHLSTLSERINALPIELREDALYSMSFNDIREPFLEALAFHGLSWEQLAQHGKEGVISLLNAMPSRRIDLHLHRQILRNPGLRPRMTDLDDWAALGPAAAYCDVVVCEKHFADLLLRDGQQPRAKIAARLSSLEELLTTAA